MTRSSRWLAAALSLALGGCAAAGNPETSGDGGVLQGSDVASDGGSPDGAVPTDTGSNPDAGTVTDTATAVDTGTPVDGGTPPDVATPTDTGTGTDAGGGMDIGTVTDTGAGVDVVGPTDTGVVTPTDTGGGTCPGGRTLCSAVCVDAQSDNLNCGACGHGCSTGEVCAAGTCVMALRGLVLSELRPASVAYIELFNGGNATVDLSGYRVQWSTNAGGSGSVTLPTYPLASGAFVVLRGGTATAPAGSVSLGTDLSWTTDIAVRLLAPSGLGIDFVRTGPSTAAAPAGTTWVGPGTPNPTADTDQSLVRAVYRPDTDTAADWSLAARPSPGAYCARPGVCGPACVDFESDTNNCGGCGYHCVGTQTCRSGVCVAGTGHAWLSEYRLHGRPGVEIQNPSSATINLAGYRVQVAPVTGATFSFFLPTHSLPPGGFVMVYADSGTDDAVSIYSGMTMGFGPDVALSLFDSTSTGIDFVRVGATAMTPPVGLSWFGPSVAAPSAAFDVSIRRDITTFDTDSAADWSVSGPSTPGYLCDPGLTTCGGRCVDRSIDRGNCGGCGTACGPHQTCIAGACRAIGSLVLSELAASNQSFELFNGTATAMDLGGYILDWVADGGSATYNIPTGTMLPSGGFIRFRPGAGTSTANDIAMGTAVSVNWTNYIAVSVRTPLNVGVDFVKTGASPTPPPAGTAWTGATATNPVRTTGQSLVRNLWAADTDSAGDWSISAAATPLSYCPSPTATTVICGTACVDTQSSAAHCGACGNTCNSAACVNGQCSDVVLYHGWPCPIPGCITSGYSLTATTADGGTYPYNPGDSANCRAWKLAATVCNTAPVGYGTSPPGDWSCPSSGGFSNGPFGTYCAVSNQYSCSDCYGACNAMCSRVPLSLRNCSGAEVSQP